MDGYIIYIIYIPPFGHSFNIPGGKSNNDVTQCPCSYNVL